jgi:dihydroneopterin aldolase
MDKIMFQGMQFYAYHGVFPEENKLGQTYLVDLDVYMDLQPAGESDQLEKTINYAHLYELVQKIVEGESCKLIEALAEKIASQALQTFQPMQEIMVRVTKPNPPIPGHYDTVAVEIRRRR